MVFLLLVMLAVALFQKEAGRFYACCTFVVLTFAHAVLFRDAGGMAYYTSAAAFDLFIIYFLSMETKEHKLVNRLQVLSLLSIALNFIGWSMWVSYMSPNFYDAAYVVFYFVAILSMLHKDKAYDVGDHELGSGFAGVRVDSDSCNSVNSKNRAR